MNMETVWIQNLKGFIKGVFPANEQWKKIFIEKLDAVDDGAWQLINTVTDGEQVLIYDPKYDKVFHAIAWKNGTYADPVYNEWDGNSATHWMPLPEPPVTS